jgi:arginase family enzyme
MQPTIHLIGLPTDQNSSFERGAALGAAAVRKALWSDRGNAGSRNCIGDSQKQPDCLEKTASTLIALLP